VCHEKKNSVEDVFSRSKGWKAVDKNGPKIRKTPGGVPGGALKTVND
jgi:hypothetical protein